MNSPLPNARPTRLEAVSRDVLEHFRNLLTVATLLALGLVARHRSDDLLGSSIFKETVGWGVITLAAGLAALNLWMGVNRLKQWKHWKLWSAVLLAAYAVIALRVMEVMALIRLEGK